jgi:hypothetical protein
MKTIYLILFNVFSIIIVNAQPKNLITSEIRVLVNEINTARLNPKLYGVNNNLEFERLDTILNKEPLNISYKLCQKAHSYCTYLSNSKSKDHAFKISHSSMGYNESIALNNDLSEVIKQLIYDKDHLFKGHRYHLLSVNNKDKDIGIGISYISFLDWYIVVIITE